jgi:hypothetical protein
MSAEGLGRVDPMRWYPGRAGLDRRIDAAVSCEPVAEALPNGIRNT